MLFRANYIMISYRLWLAKNKSLLIVDQLQVVQWKAVVTLMAAPSDWSKEEPNSRWNQDICTITTKTFPYV